MSKNLEPKIVDVAKIEDLKLMQYNLSEMVNLASSIILDLHDELAKARKGETSADTEKLAFKEMGKYVVLKSYLSLANEILDDL